MECSIESSRRSSAASGSRVSSRASVVFQAAQTFFRLGRAPLAFRLVGVALYGGFVGFLQGPVQGVDVALQGPSLAVKRCSDASSFCWNCARLSRLSWIVFSAAATRSSRGFGPRHQQLVIVGGLGLHISHAR